MESIKEPMAASHTMVALEWKGGVANRAPDQAPLVRAKARNPMTVYIERCLLLLVRTDPHIPTPREDRRQHE